MSTFVVPVVKIERIEKHPNADALSITECEGCPVILKTTDFQVGDLAVYVPVEAVVPLSNPAFAFLGTKEGQEAARIKAKKLRGIFSMGLLVPLAVLKDHHKFSEMVEGVDVSDLLGIVKYVEPERHAPNMKLGGTQREKDSSTAPIYDIENYRKYKKGFVEGEEVVVTEKIHGCNGRFVFRTGTGEETPRLFVGSRNFFNKETPDNVWWKVARKHGLEEKLAHPAMEGKVLYGEVYGQVQDLKYGTTQEDPLRFAAFDIFDPKTGRYLDYCQFEGICTFLDIPMVPILFWGPYKPEVIEPLALGNSSIADQIKEGFVIKPTTERWDPRVGRFILKLVGEQYLLRKGGTEFQ